ncbi:hypothetical protein BH23ACT1_BH23ACT1_03470 [soil metagenome]
MNGLATALWWLGEVSEAMRCWEAAYAGFRRRGDSVQAVVVAVHLSLLHNANFGNRAVSAGWSARAARLADALEMPVIHGWVLLTKAVTCTDPEQGQAWAREAQQLAAESDDRDLELCALSTLGSALVDEGRVEQGAALLEEALAASLAGETDNPETVVFTSCLLMQSCYRCADFVRVAQWAKALDAFIERYGCPYVNATCRAHHGAMLFASGDWQRAEEELAVARRLAGDALPAVQAEALAYLADLRLAQGQVEEARRLLAGFEHHVVVAPVLAAAWLAGGDAAVAVSTVLRSLDQAGGRHLEAARLREVLGEARLALGEQDGAADQGQRLADLGARLGCELMVARGERLVGRALLSGPGSPGAEPEASPHLEEALAAFSLLEMPLEVGRTRMLLAEAVHADATEVAVAEARAALTLFEDLGAAGDADAAASWLRAHGATAARAGPRGLSVLTKRERGVLAVVGEGLSNPEIAERLYISRRTVEHHVAAILAKLGLRNRAEAAAYAARHLAAK